MPVVSFVELYETRLWVVWGEQYEPYTPFLPRPSSKELNVPQLNTMGDVCYETPQIKDSKSCSFIV